MAHKGRKNADEIIALSIASGMTSGEAAKVAKVSERTVASRLNDAGFNKLVRKHRRTMTDRAVGMLSEGMTQSAQVLIAALKSENERVRIKAARDVIELRLKVADLSRLQDRLADLERRLEASGTLKANAQLSRDEIFQAALEGAAAARAAYRVPDGPTGPPVPRPSPPVDSSESGQKPAECSTQ